MNLILLKEERAELFSLIEQCYAYARRYLEKFFLYYTYMKNCNHIAVIII